METMVGVSVTPVLFTLVQKMAEWSEKRINTRLGHSPQGVESTVAGESKR